MELGAFSVSLAVKDLAASKRFYEKLGFRRVPVYCIKRKNPINEPLFVPDAVPGLDDLNPYARIIADEALRRGIEVEVLDAEWVELRLTSGARSIVTRESLSELTSAVAMSRCDDKRMTRRVLERAGLRVPRAIEATGTDADHRALAPVARAHAEHRSPAAGRPAVCPRGSPRRPRTPVPACQPAGAHPPANRRAHAFRECRAVLRTHPVLVFELWEGSALGFGPGPGLWALGFASGFELGLGLGLGPRASGLASGFGLRASGLASGFVGGALAAMLFTCRPHPVAAKAPPTEVLRCAHRQKRL